MDADRSVYDMVKITPIPSNASYKLEINYHGSPRDYYSVRRWGEIDFLIWHHERSQRKQAPPLVGT